MIRTAQTSDISAIASIHVQSWKTTYQDIVKQSLLDNITLEKRKVLWQKVLADPDSLVLLYLFEDCVVGLIDGYFVAEHANAEIRALYLLQAYQQRGIGQALLNAMLDEFKQSNYVKVHVSVLDKNPSVSFYLKQGAKLIDQKDASVYGDDLKELIYEWAI